MRVFISWSGTASRTVAQALYETLPLMLQNVTPWSSFGDIVPGDNWGSNIAFELQRAEFAIVCVTPENLKSPWIHFEVGALLKSLGPTRVCPFLIGFSPADLSGPLMQFQAVEATHDGTRRLVKALNEADDANILDPRHFELAFQTWWPRLEESILSAVGEPTPSKPVDAAIPGKEGPAKTERALLEEILRKLATGDAPAAEPAGVREPEFVFLVHGRAVEKAESIARYVEKLGPKVVILQEQPNQGRTVIEKFEDHAAVVFAIVLMTGDDQGGLVGAAADELQPRARQNVVLELGYFLARLGRRLVVVLYEEGVEVPSDYSGVLFIPLDPGGAWRLTLARELRAGGVAVDVNAAL